MRRIRCPYAGIRLVAPGGKVTIIEPDEDGAGGDDVTFTDADLHHSSRQFGAERRAHHRLGGGGRRKVVRNDRVAHHDHLPRIRDRDRRR